MKALPFVFAIGMSVASFGCKKGGDCQKAIDHSMELSKADMSKMPGMDDKMMGKLKDMGVQHCKDDKWPEDAIKCMTDAKSETDSQACFSKLSHEQQDKMNKAMMEMMKSAMPATPPGTADMGGSAAAGSAAPAAGEGSAAPAAAGSAAGSAAH